MNGQLNSCDSFQSKSVVRKKASSHNLVWYWLLPLLPAASDSMSSPAIFPQRIDQISGAGFIARQDLRLTGEFFPCFTQIFYCVPNFTPHFILLSIKFNEHHYKTQQVKKMSHLGMCPVTNLRSRRQKSPLSLISCLRKKTI